MNNLCVDEWCMVYYYLTPQYHIKAMLVLSQNSHDAFQQTVHNFQRQIQTKIIRLQQLQQELTLEKYQLVREKLHLRSSYLYDRLHFIQSPIADERKGIIMMLCNQQYGRKFIMDCPSQILSEEIHFESMQGLHGMLCLSCWCRAYNRLQQLLQCIRNNKHV